MKVLMLQDETYFLELGVRLDGCDVVYGLPFTMSIRKTLVQFDVVVSCLDHDDSAHEVICIANSLGVPTAYISDGVYDVTNANKNPILKRSGRIQLMPAAYGTIFCVGKGFSKWYKQQWPYVDVYDYTPARASLDAGLCSNSAYNQPKVLITTALTPYFDDEDFYSLIDELARLIQFLRNSNIFYVFRIFDERICEALPEINSRNTVLGTLSDALEGVSCVVSSTSTVLHSCYIYGIKSILLNHRNSETLYDVDVIVLKGGELDKSFFESVDQALIRPDSVVLGMSFSDYDYRSDGNLICSYKDGWNLKIAYYLRMAYRRLPMPARKYFKKLVSGL